jgi:hypothetical protein
MNRRESLKCCGVCAGAGETGVSLAGSAAAGQLAPPQAPHSTYGAMLTSYSSRTGGADRTSFTLATCCW